MFQNNSGSFDYSMLPFGAGAAALGGIFGMGNDFKNPADAAMPWFKKIPGLYSPFIQAGQAAYPGLQNAYSSMMNDPSGVLNKIGAGYKESPGYQFALQQAMNASGNASAAGGMLGTPMAQQTAMNTASGVASQDYDTWLSHALGLFGGGLQGEQGMYNKGFDATNNLATSYGNIGQMLAGGAEAQNQYNANRQKQWADMWGGVGGAIDMMGFL